MGVGPTETISSSGASKVGAPTGNFGILHLNYVYIKVFSSSKLTDYNKNNAKLFSHKSDKLMSQRRIQSLTSQ